MERKVLEDHRLVRKVERVVRKACRDGESGLRGIVVEWEGTTGHPIRFDWESYRTG